MELFVACQSHVFVSKLREPLLSHQRLQNLLLSLNLHVKLNMYCSAVLHFSLLLYFLQIISQTSCA